MDASLYPPEYYASHGYGSDPRREAAYAQEAARVQARATGWPPRRVLDVGCGVGAFLDHFPDSGWCKFGVELSEYAASRARERRVHVPAYAQSYDYPDLFFDLVVFRGSLQHLDEPFTALRQATRLLRRGGLLAILATPNAESLPYRLFGELPALDPPRNWWVPSRRTLEAALRRLGYLGLEFYYPYWGGPYARPGRDLARFVLRLAGARRPFAWPGNMLECYARKEQR